MFKLCKWIYKLGYGRGYEVGYDQASRDLNEQQLEKQLLEFIKEEQI